MPRCSPAAGQSVTTTESDAFIVGTDGNLSAAIVVISNLSTSADTLWVRCPDLGHEANGYVPLAAGERVEFAGKGTRMGAITNVRWRAAVGTATAHVYVRAS